MVVGSRVQKFARSKVFKGGRQMKFNFPIFARLAERAYNQTFKDDIKQSILTVSEMLDIFWYYFERYEYYHGGVHPNIRMAQIEDIMYKIDFIDVDRKIGAELAGVDGYKKMINKHFKTNYRHGDYNINHFFTGDIRLFRFYEVLKDGNFDIGDK